MTLSRRGFLGGILAAAAAPMIVRAGILMPIKPALVAAWPPSMNAAGMAILNARANAIMRQLVDELAGQLARDFYCYGTAIVRSDGTRVDPRKVFVDPSLAEKPGTRVFRNDHDAAGLYGLSIPKLLGSTSLVKP